MRLFNIVFAILLLPMALSGQVRFVDAAAAGGGDGKSWTTAYNLLGPALAGSGSGTTLWVAHGIYRGGFTVPAGVTLLGGFASGDRRETQRRPADQATILDGERKQRVVNLGAGSRLDGFTIQNGRATTFEGGGGALVDGVSATISHCLFIRNANTAGRGAALHVRSGGSLRLDNSVFTKNEGSGHVIDFTVAGGLVTHIVVHDNVSNGLHFHSGSSPRVYNSVFSSNSGSGLCHISASDNPVMRNNLFHANAIALYHYRGKDMKTLAEVNNLAYASGNRIGDPRFLDPARLDFRIAAGSAGLDAGLDTVPGTGPTARDLYGNGRHLDGDLDGLLRTDMGVAEYAVASLGVGGTGTRGGFFAVTLAGPAASPALLLIGLAPGETRIAPLGWLLLDPTATILGLPWSVGPTVNLPIPLEMSAGTGILFQSLVVGGKGGNLTNAVDARVR